MTRQEANKKAIHYRCGGRLQVAQKQVEGKSIWIVGVRCVKCKAEMRDRQPYKRWLEGEKAKQDRLVRAIAAFNTGPAWEDDDDDF
jgi:hypothetical protein